MTEQRRIGRFYGIAGVIVIVFIALFLVVENAVYVQTRHVYSNIMGKMDCVSQMNDTIAEINENTMLLVAGMGDESNVAKIQEQFEYLNMIKAYYEPMVAGDAIEARRYAHANFALQAYERKMNEVGETLISARYESALSIYSQEIEPLKATAEEMLAATVEAGSAGIDKDTFRATMTHGLAQSSMILLTIAGVIALFFAGRAQIRKTEEIQLKEEELEEASDRLVASRQKLMDSAHTNILTGLRNRYGLEKYLADVVGKRQFYIAVFDIDNFRMVNDQYGYECGNEYLIAVSDRLKAMFADSAELFNIYGNEFCLIFNDSLTDMQVKSLAEQVRQNIGSNTQVSGMMIASTVSGSLAHILPSENVDTATVLSRLDTALHAAKRDGGNRLYYI